MSTQQALRQPPTRSRVDALRWKIIEAPQEVCIERARYLTEAMRLHWDKHPLDEDEPRLRTYPEQYQRHHPR